jgi:hypothetical protein
VLSNFPLPKRSVIFLCSVILLHCSAQSFFFATVLNHFPLPKPSVIFLCYSAQSFCFAIVLNHFPLPKRSIIFLCYSAQSFCFTTVLSHFALLHCFIILLPRCSNTQPFLVAPVLSHSSCYRAQPFLIAIVLNHSSFALVLSHSSLLQCSAMLESTVGSFADQPSETNTGDEPWNEEKETMLLCRVK